MSHKITIEIPSDGDCNSCIFTYLGFKSRLYCKRFDERLYHEDEEEYTGKIIPFKDCENKWEGK